MDAWRDGGMDGERDVWMDAWRDAGMDGGRDGWMEGWMDTDMDTNTESDKGGFNPVVAQSTRLDVSIGLQHVLKSQRSRL